MRHIYFRTEIKDCECNLCRRTIEKKFTYIQFTNLNICISCARTLSRDFAEVFERVKKKTFPERKTRYEVIQ